ncbi:NAD-dependent epimerase [Maribacter sp. 2307ULW6-5]|uniref:NAD-dependent epimerase n=1 Tax=Maribacter sp. 2307ULW6-5 TaxID=3386275 RepID=UPI0039BCE7C2
MKVLVTGAAGFIGFYVSKMLLEKGHTVVGLDNINDYYSIDLKYARLAQLGIDRNKAEVFGTEVASATHPEFRFVRMGLEDRAGLPQLFAEHGFDAVCNLAAQAGVRYSLENPHAYMDSNMVGFLNVLECCRHHKIKHLVYASSSSVYGLNDKVPFETTDRVDHPISLYAATKKSNELMAHTYSHLYGFPSTGLRFFTVYGPWGRPDMAYFSFTKAIRANTPITVYNEGKLSRDFTYIDDIVQGLVRILEQGPVDPPQGSAPATIYNIGRGRPVALMDFIETIAKGLGTTPQLQMLPMQDGDVLTTWADTTALEKDYGYTPKIGLKQGMDAFLSWYATYHD